MRGVRLVVVVAVVAVATSPLAPRAQATEAGPAELAVAHPRAGDSLPDPFTFVPTDDGALPAGRPEARMANLDRLAGRAAPDAPIEGPSPHSMTGAAITPPSSTAATPILPASSPALTPDGEEAADAPVTGWSSPSLPARTPSGTGGATPDAVGQVSGSIRNEVGDPLAGITVVVTPPGQRSWELTTTTGIDGTYTILVPEGEYEVLASDPAETYARTWYWAGGWSPDFGETTVVPVTAAGVTGIDIAMEPFRHVRGRVIDEEGQPIAGLQVRTDGLGWAITDAEGAWAIRVDPVDSIKIGYQGYLWPYRGGWYSSHGFVSTEAEATVISVAFADVSGIDVALPYLPSVTGRVVDAAGRPVAGLRVAFPYNTYQVGATDADGRYRVFVQPGSGVVRGMFGYPDYALGWVHQYADADLREVDVATIDVVMEAYPTVRGRVTDEAGEPLAGIEVYAGGHPSPAVTDADGRFLVYRPSAAAAGVLYVDPSDVHVSGWLGSSGFVNHPPDAHAFTVGFDEILDADVVLPRWLTVSGTVSLADGSPVTGGPITLGEPGRSSITVEISPDGSFAARVAPGDYVLTVAGGWYGAEGFAAHPAAAIPIALDVGADRIDVVLPPTTAIRGRVMGNGVALSGLEVMVFQNGNWVAGASTEADGWYEVPIAPGAYLVGVQGGDLWTTGYYSTTGFVSDPLQASLVAVGGRDAEGIDLTVAPGRYLSGKVLDIDGYPVRGAYVEAWVNGRFYSGVYADGNGAYVVPVAPGSVTLWALDPLGENAPGWRTTTGLTADWAKATPVTVGSGDVSGIKIIMPSPGTLTVYVSFQEGPSSTSVGRGVTVTAVANGQVAGRGRTGDSGRAMFAALPGTYTIFADVPSVLIDDDDGWAIQSRWAPAWYTTSGPVGDPALATPVVLKASASVSMTLPQAGAVETDVQDLSGARLSGIAVDLVADGGVSVTGRTWGQPLLLRAMPGTYRIAVSDLYGAFRPGWLGADGWVADSAHAIPVTVGTSIEQRTIRLPLDAPPAAPTGVHGTPHDRAVTIGWTAPETDATRPLIHFHVRALPGGRTCVASATPSCTVTGLQNGVPYTFTVTASSMMGAGPASAPSAAFTPVATPSSPGLPVVVVEDDDVAVSWAASASGTDPVLGYTATVMPGGRHCSPVPATSTNCVVADLPDGRYEVSVQAENALGTSASSRRVALVVDTVPPIVVAPVPFLLAGGTMSGSAVPIGLTWSATDTLGRVTLLELERSADGGAYRDVALPTVPVASVETTVNAGAEYRFRLRATDDNGRTSTWATSPARQVLLRQEGGPGVAYGGGGWSTTSSSKALGGKVRVTSAKGAWASFTFAGRSATWVTRVGPSSGAVKVYLDGKLIGTGDYGSSVTRNRWIGFVVNFASSGKHVIKLVCVGTSGRPRMYVDAFVAIR